MTWRKLQHHSDTFALLWRRRWGLGWCGWDCGYEGRSREKTFGRTKIGIMEFHFSSKRVNERGSTLLLIWAPTNDMSVDHLNEASVREEILRTLWVRFFVTILHDVMAINAASPGNPLAFMHSIHDVLWLVGFTDGILCSACLQILNAGGFLFVCLFF